MEELFNLELFGDSENSDSDFEESVLLHFDNEYLGNRAALYGRFNFEGLNEIECKKLFRFHKEDIPRLRVALCIPNRIVTSSRVSVSGTEALCILLRRLAYPNRFIDLEPIFGLASSCLSDICNHMTQLIKDNKVHLLGNLQNNNYLNHARLKHYSQAIKNKGSPVNNCWGFIDGTARPICRPSVNQQNYYSGHKKTHCVKYQSVLCPDGIVVSLKGAYEGRRHDSGILRESGLYSELENSVVFPDEQFVLYGDQGYAMQELLLRPYSQNELIGRPERQAFNTAMGVLRVSVEWGFGKIVQQFAFLDFKKNQKLLLQDISSMYQVGTILTNCHTCLYGSETATYFNLSPPKLEEYLQCSN